MRVLGMIDSFPASDLGLIKALTKNGDKPSKRQIMEMAEGWRPYRAYANIGTTEKSKNALRLLILIL
jgi:3-methyladenine DNA glycosylase/8-oxoguanine DNA glycosylase